ncbi:hypothetical protein Brsp05_02786 [Brucella sp. NBRC 12953]|uniref:hypothetical protein n=1 Tax=Brucella sp. NBRC 12953 TaxID=3075481 RepID=UPI0030AFD0BE
MATIKLVNVDEHDLAYAANLAVHFVRQYPDRMGLRNGVAFTKDCVDYSLYIYRTKTQIVVRGRESSPLGEQSE